LRKALRSARLTILRSRRRVAPLASAALSARVSFPSRVSALVVVSRGVGAGAAWEGAGCAPAIGGATAPAAAAMPAIARAVRARAVVARA